MISSYLSFRLSAKISFNGVLRSPEWFLIKTEIFLRIKRPVLEIFEFFI